MVWTPLFSLLAVSLCQIANGHHVPNDVLKLANATFDFAEKLRRIVTPDKPTFVFSPYSIHSVLTMTSMGAKTDTETEMKKVLNLDYLQGSDPHRVYHQLIESLNSATEVKVLTGNGIFVKQEERIVPEFVSAVKSEYVATVDKIDISIINDYVANKTEQEIKHFLSPGSIPKDTSLILISTLFFKGLWKLTFPKQNTKLTEFRKLDGTTTMVEMMYDTRIVNIKVDYALDVDILELPFEGEVFSLFIVLPHKERGIIELETSLSTPLTVRRLTNLRTIYAKVAIPKFKIETKLRLKDYLQSMGMRKAFDRQQADFSGITNNKVLYLDEVIHKSVIEVLENGTIAAAASSSHIRPNTVPRLNFIADHPFLFYLVDKKNTLVLFSGKFSG